MPVETFSVLGQHFKLHLDPAVYSDEVLLGCGKRREAPEPETLAMMHKVIRQGDTVIDGGANIGFFALFMARLVGPQGSVHAFEPLPMNLAKLRTNIDLNGFDNVIVHQEALSDQSGTTAFYPNQDNGQSSLWNPGGGTPIEVVTARLDDFKFKPSFVKLDIEGAEEKCYKGGPITLSQAFVVCELNDTALRAMGSSPLDLRRYAMGIGQYTWAINAKEHPLLLPITTDIVAKRGNTNVLFASIAKVAAVWSQVVIE